MIKAGNQLNKNLKLLQEKLLPLPIFLMKEYKG